MKLVEVIHNNCTGCRQCEFVCSLAHEAECSTAKSRIRIYRDEEFGNNLIAFCRQCADAPCLLSCPAAALSRNIETGAIVVDNESCIGCQTCVAACPLGAISMDREKDVAFKCDLCGGDPECVKWCNRDALAFKECDPASRDRESLRLETLRLFSRK